MSNASIKITTKDQLEEEQLEHFQKGTLVKEATQKVLARLMDAPAGDEQTVVFTLNDRPMPFGTTVAGLDVPGLLKDFMYKPRGPKKKEVEKKEVEKKEVEKKEVAKPRGPKKKEVAE